MPFLYVAGSQFDDKYVGVGAKRVRKLFEAARYFSFFFQAKELFVKKKFEDGLKTKMVNAAHSFPQNQFTAYGLNRDRSPAW